MPCPPPVTEAPPPQPVLAGFVHDADAPDKGVPNATVTYAGLALNAQITDANGRFRSYPMPSGRMTVAVSAEGYEDATFEVDIPEPTMGFAGDGDLMGVPPEATAEEPPIAPETGEAGASDAVWHGEGAQRESR